MTFLAAVFGLLAGLVAGAAFQRWFTGAAGPEHLPPAPAAVRPDWRGSTAEYWKERALAAEAARPAEATR